MKPRLRPMKGEAITPDDFSRLRYPLLASQKLDAVRARISGGQLLSSKLKRIKNLQARSIFEGRRELDGLEGELMMMRGSVFLPCRTVAGLLNSPKADLSQLQVVLFAFDDVSRIGNPFGERIKSVGRRAKGPVVRLQHQLITSAAALREFYEHAMKMGWEGIVVRSIDGPYKSGRSTVGQGWFLKVKKFVDAEGTLLDVLPRYRNENPPKRGRDGLQRRSSHKANKVRLSTAGALLVRYQGATCKVNRGWTDEEGKWLYRNRAALVRKKTQVTFQWQPSGAKDKPRFATFKMVRQSWD